MMNKPQSFGTAYYAWAAATRGEELRLSAAAFGQVCALHRQAIDRCPAPRERALERARFARFLLVHHVCSDDPRAELRLAASMLRWALDTLQQMQDRDRSPRALELLHEAFETARLLWER